MNGLYSCRRGLLFALAATAWLAVPFSAQLQESRVVVITNNAPIQSGEEILARVSRGQQLQVQERRGEWLQVSIPGQGGIGWIHSKFTQPARSNNPPPVNVTSGTAKEQCLANYNLAQSLKAEGKYREAVAPYERAAQLAAAAFGENSNNHRVIFYNLALLYQDLAEYPKAEAAYLKARDIQAQQSDQRDPDVEHGLATLYRLTGDYARSEQHSRQAIAAAISTEGADSVKAAQCENGLALLFTSQHKYAEAEQLLLRCASIYEKHLGEDPRLAGIFDNLAICYDLQEDMAKPEQYYLRALKIRREKQGEDHLDTSRTMQNLADFYQEVGDYQKAEPLFLRALAIQSARLGEDHPMVAGVRNNLGNLYRVMGRLPEAEEQLTQAVHIVDARLEKDDLTASKFRANLALFYYSTGRTNDALRLWQRVAETYRERIGENASYALIANGMACAYMDLGKHAEADQLLRKSVAIREQALGESHPDLAQGLANLGRNAAFMQDWASAAKDLDRSRRVIRRHVSQVLPGLNQEQQLGYLRKRDEYQLSSGLSIGYERRDDPQLAAMSADWLLNAKGMVQEVLAQQALVGRQFDSPELRSMAERLRLTRQELAAQTYQTPGTEREVKQRLQRLAELQEKEQALLRMLNAASAGTLAQGTWIELDQLREKLPDDGVFVQIYRFELENFTDKRREGPHYVAWLIFPEDDEPVRVVDLGSAEDVETAAAAARKAIEAGPELILEEGEAAAEAKLRQAMLPLAEKILHPLLPQIAGRTRWLISPDAALWLVPWAALPLPDESYAVESHCVQYLTSGRELLAERSPVTPGPPLMLADPDYDLSAEERRLAAADAPQLRAVVGTTRSSSLLPKVPRLPGTAQEVETVAPLLEKYAGAQATVLQREAALERSCQSARSPRVLVLSTHGFFLDDQRIDESSAETATGVSEEQKRAVLAADGQPLENPLLRCGLLLAGCNQRADAQAFDDGVLTGLEIVGMDLRGTELVVLSACETGLGEVQNGEGVAGLRQAFQLAGARAVVATLWKVPDRETGRLMGSFFEHLAGDASQAESLRQAQLDLIAQRREKLQAAHPFFWAAVTITGN